MLTRTNADVAGRPAQPCGARQRRGPLLKKREKWRTPIYDFHFITCSCYRRQPLLGTPRRRDLFLTVLEQVRRRYQFVVAGYVVMPEHIHLLLSEPQVKILSTVMALEQLSRLCP